jgi:hypothetical protein
MNEGKTDRQAGMKVDRQTEPSPSALPAGFGGGVHSPWLSLTDTKGRKEGRKEWTDGRKEGRRKGRKEGRKEGRKPRKEAKE